jgi:tetratricopeptide (TPR) repeat protein
MESNLVKSIVSRGGVIKSLMVNSETLTGLCNPSIIFTSSGDLLVNIRHVNYVFTHNEASQKYQGRFGPLCYLHPENDHTLKTENYLCKVDPVTLEIISSKKIDTSGFDTPSKWEFIGLEDGRLVEWENKVYLTGVRRDTEKTGIGRMELSELRNSTEVSRTRIEPPTPSYCDKNWMPLLDGKPNRYVKWVDPLEVVEVDKTKNTAKTIIKKQRSKYSYPYDLRGGTQVISLHDQDLGEIRVCIVHETNFHYNEANRKEAQYNHRIVTWDKHFNLVNISEPFKFLTGKVEFACGLAENNGDTYITFGFQDNAAYLLKFSTDILLDYIKNGIESTSVLTKLKSYSGILDIFVDSPYDPTANYELATYYEQNSQYAAAISYYLRSAEYELKNTELIYKALLKIATLLTKLGNREESVKAYLLQATTVRVTSPEAYLLLSLACEKSKQWHEAYSYAKLAYFFKENSLKLDFTGTEVRYIFQVAVTGWWAGNYDESRELFGRIRNEYREIPADIQKLVDSNIVNLTKHLPMYDKYESILYGRFKFPFPGLEKIKYNYSQAYQDLFVLAIHNGKKDGFYIEIGSNHPENGNNTKLLEEFNWKGVSYDIDVEIVEEFNTRRLNKAVVADGTLQDYTELSTIEVDYLQVDCDPPLNSLKALEKVLEDGVRPIVITFEHDMYTYKGTEVQELSREKLTKLGYTLIVPNVNVNGVDCFEDWWVLPYKVRRNPYLEMFMEGKDYNNVKQFFLK